LCPNSAANMAQVREKTAATTPSARTYQRGYCNAPPGMWEKYSITRLGRAAINPPNAANPKAPTTTTHFVKSTSRSRLPRSVTLPPLPVMRRRRGGLTDYRSRRNCRSRTGNESYAGKMAQVQASIRQCPLDEQVARVESRSAVVGPRCLSRHRDARGHAAPDLAAMSRTLPPVRRLQLHGLQGSHRANRGYVPRDSLQPSRTGRAQDRGFGRRTHV
jgi:hypothetical protein